MELGNLMIIKINIKRKMKKENESLLGRWPRKCKMIINNTNG